MREDDDLVRAGRQPFVAIDLIFAALDDGPRPDGTLARAAAGLERDRARRQRPPVEEPAAGDLLTRDPIALAASDGARSANVKTKPMRTHEWNRRVIAWSSVWNVHRALRKTRSRIVGSPERKTGLQNLLA